MIAPDDPKEPARHIAVMATEVLRELITDPAGTYVDTTIGNAGHAELAMERLNHKARLIGLDRDRDAVAIAKARLARFGSRVTVCHSDYRRLGDVCRELGVRHITGALIDLGLSSLQLDDPARGFSYQLDGPLDLRFDTLQGTPASEWLNKATQESIAKVLAEYGEEPHARKLARMIVAARADEPVETTNQLKQIIIGAMGQRGAVWGRTAARVLQALRIHVNAELDAIPLVLGSAIDLLEENGRLVVITYHSLEDRLVKLFFREASRICTCPPVFPHCICGAQPKGRVVHRHVLRPADAEVAANPRSRAAKMRVFEKHRAGTTEESGR
jgi:16S rRNA (cytosine1402-N4)-methyltransferase